jgi:hypothetical protein
LGAVDESATHQLDIESSPYRHAQRIRGDRALLS